MAFAAQCHQLHGRPSNPIQLNQGNRIGSDCAVTKLHKFVFRQFQQIMSGVAFGFRGAAEFLQGGEFCLNLAQSEHDEDRESRAGQAPRS